MDSVVNLPAIYIANLIGILLMFIMVLGNQWLLRAHNRENKYLFAMVLVTFIACIIDPLVFSFDGKAGLLAYIAVYYGNLILYLSNIFLALFWFLFLACYLGISFNKIYKAIFITTQALGVVLLIVNLFIPLVFTVNEENVYSRESLYWIYVVVEFAFFVASFIVYLIIKRKGGALKHFPIQIFMIPVFLGTAIQSFVYGVSTMFPFTAIAIIGVFSYIQNESMFRDKLTGLYNRFYLENLKKKLDKSTKNKFAVIMLDLNGFKYINDTWGHGEGDEALIIIASLLRNVIGSFGEVVRYAGDEFIILLNSQDDEFIQNKKNAIREKLDYYNGTKQKPYELSVSIGSVKLDLATSTLDELFDRVDKDMYQDKKRFYTENPQLNRRKGGGPS